jgi:hypothetical protein
LLTKHENLLKRLLKNRKLRQQMSRDNDAGLGGVVLRWWSSDARIQITGVTAGSAHFAPKNAGAMSDKLQFVAG